MKLQELVSSDGYVVDLYEVFNATREVNWYHDQGAYCGDFEVNNAQYRVLFEPFVYQNKFNCLNVAFQIKNKNEWSTKPTYDNKSASVVMGVVVNALYEKKDYFDYDALIFVATDNTDKRMRIYNSIARWKLKDLGTIIENIPLGLGKIGTVIVSDNIKNTDDFKEWLTTIELKN